MNLCFLSKALGENSFGGKLIFRVKSRLNHFCK